MMAVPRIAVIGGGAAGMMTVATLLSSCDRRVSIDLYESNARLGTKVRISGGGRCNVTTGTYKTSDLMSAYTRGASFLLPSIKRFGPKKVRKRFVSHGVALKQEADGRIFPCSNNGDDIVGLFEQLFAQHDDRLTIHYRTRVSQITHTADQRFVITAQSHSETAACQHTYDYLVLATGGNAYAHTGSRGDGYSRARAHGHTITQLGPSLTRFLSHDKRLHTLSGISFADAALHATPDTEISSSNKKQPTPQHTTSLTARGPVLLTHDGISGPATFVIASHIAWHPVTPTHPTIIRLQIDATKDAAYRDQQLISHAHMGTKQHLRTRLATAMPKRVATKLCSRYTLNPTQPISTLTKKERQQIASLLGDGIPITLIGRKAGDEFVTAGGIETDEIDPTTMMSRIVPGLYCVGELLNIDGITGGYNLQAARSTGYVAGQALAARLTTQREQ